MFVHEYVGSPGACLILGLPGSITKACDLHESHSVSCWKEFVGQACSSVLMLFQALHNSNNMLSGHGKRLQTNRETPLVL